MALLRGGLWFDATEEKWRKESFCQRVSKTIAKERWVARALTR